MLVHVVIPCMFPSQVVNYLLKRLQLNYHRNIITDGYSCGTRRKLSTALALIGHPQILLLVRTHLLTLLLLPISFANRSPDSRC